jgi:mitogen-activated protein kinase organizer 1
MDFKETRRLRGHVGAVLCARFTKDGAYALTAGADRSVKLWNPARGHPDTGALLIKNYVGPHAKEISQICVADDCSRFASVGGDKGAFLWDVATGAVARRLQGHDARVNCCAFCAPGDQLLATGSYDRTLKFWDLRSSHRHPLQTVDDFGDSVTSVALSKETGGGLDQPAQFGRHGVEAVRQKKVPATDTSVVVGCVDGKVRTYDLRKGRLHADDFKVPVTSVSVSRDGHVAVASCLDGSARLIEVATGTQLNRYTGHAHEKYALESCFSHDDAYLCSGSEDGRVVVWRLVEATVVCELKAHTAAACSVRWHPKCARLLVGSHDGTASVWEA